MSILLHPSHFIFDVVSGDFQCWRGRLGLFDQALHESPLALAIVFLQVLEIALGAGGNHAITDRFGAAIEFAIVLGSAGSLAPLRLWRPSHRDDGDVAGFARTKRRAFGRCTEAGQTGQCLGSS